MKIFILSDPQNIHTKRWVSSLANQGIKIYLFGLNSFDNSFYIKYDNVKVFSFNYEFSSNEKTSDGTISKIRYLKVVKTLKEKIEEFKPDILHAHYASSYGLLGALAGFNPYVISVWGSDIYLFPKVSIFHRFILKYNLKKADFILSTSHIMAKETQKYTNKKIQITPFGVDTNLFKKGQINQKNKIIIGTVKSLAPIYGIDVLVEAFFILMKSNPQINLELRIAGEGPMKKEIEEIIKQKGIESNVILYNKIKHEMVPSFLSELDVFVALSRSESFGVAVLEAMSCECPVVVSNADGFLEVVQNNITGLIVPINNPKIAATQLQILINDKELRQTMGKRGRQQVCDSYDWNDNVTLMKNIYLKIKNQYIL